MMEVLYLTGAKVYWVNGGHMVADALTKQSKDASMDFLPWVLEHARMRITYCEGSWRKEHARARGGDLQERRGSADDRRGCGLA